MAFSFTVRNQSYHGIGHRTLWGDWSGVAGDAAGTVAVYGYVTRADFTKMDPLDQTNQIRARTELSVANGITTITVENQDNVTTGRFMIDVMGN